MPIHQRGGPSHGQFPPQRSNVAGPHHYGRARPYPPPPTQAHQGQSARHQPPNVPRGPHFNAPPRNFPQGPFHQGRQRPRSPRAQPHKGPPQHGGFRVPVNHYTRNRKRPRHQQNPRWTEPHPSQAHNVQGAQQTISYPHEVAHLKQKHEAEIQAALHEAAMVKCRRRGGMSNVHSQPPRDRTPNGTRHRDTFKRQSAQRQQRINGNRNKMRKNRQNKGKKGKNKNGQNLLVRKNPQYPSEQSQQQQHHNRPRGARGGRSRGRFRRGRGRGRGRGGRGGKHHRNASHNQQHQHPPPRPTDDDGDSVMGDDDNDLHVEQQRRRRSHSPENVLLGADRSLARSMSPFPHAQKFVRGSLRNRQTHGSPPRPTYHSDGEAHSSKSSSYGLHSEPSGPRVLNADSLGSETPVYDPEDQTAYKKVARLLMGRPAGYADEYCDRQQVLKRRQERLLIENHYRYAADSVFKELDEMRKTRPSLPLDDFLVEYRQKRDRRRSMTDDEAEEDTMSGRASAAKDEDDDDKPFELTSAFAEHKFVSEPSSSSAASQPKEESSTTVGEVSAMLASSSISSSSASIAARRSSLPAAPPSSSSTVPRVSVSSSPIGAAPPMPPLMSSSSSSSTEPSSPSSAPLVAQREPSAPKPALALPPRRRPSPKAAVKRPACGWLNQQANDMSLLYEQYS